ncbi:MAG TPA: glycosyltransferase family 39 protein [Blastocatellia bacterium]
MIATKLRPHLAKLLLGSIFLVLSTSTVVWTLRDRTPPAWDPSDHIRYAFDYYRLLAHADFAGVAREFFTVPHYYAPMVHLVSACVFLILGATRLTGIAVNLLSLGILLWSVASISRRLYGDALPTQAASSIAPAVLPGLLAACYHFSAWLMHDAFLDFPLTAAVAAGFALLIRADDFRDRRRAIAFGVAAGLGMLVKQTFAFFFVLPGLYVAIRIIRTRDRRAILNLALAVVMLILVAAVWYAPHFRDVIAIYRENQRAAVSENEAPLFSFDSNFFYIHALISMQMQLPLGVLFAVGLVYSLFRRRKQSAILYLWLLSGIISFALVANKDVRYTVPVLPAAAVLSVCWLREFKAPTRKIVAALKSALVAILAAWALVSFFNAQWPRPGFGTAIDTPRYRWMVFARNYYGFDHRPLNDDWNVPEVVQKVSNLGREADPSSTPVLGVVVNLPYLSPSSVALYARLLTRERAAAPIVDVRWIVEPWMIDRLEECDYVLVRTGLDKADWVAPVERDFERLIRDNPARFRLIASCPIPMPDAQAVVYQYLGAQAASPYTLR